MPRPVKCRQVNYGPEALFFKPAGVPMGQLETVTLKLDELEALRLADLEGLYQEEAARKMGVSRQTFGNIVSEARRKTADALCGGKALRIEGGEVSMSGKTFVCGQCGHVWQVPFGIPRPGNCPACGSAAVERHPDERGHGMKGCGHHHRHHQGWKDNHNGRPDINSGPYPSEKKEEA